MKIYKVAELEVFALQGLDLVVNQGELLGIIGASGSGKTTLLRCVNLLEEYEAGQIAIAGTVVGYGISAGGKRIRRSEQSIAAARAQIGFVFQSFNLFPHMSVLDNVTLAPTKVLNLGRDEAEERAMTLLKRIGMEAKAQEFPDRLSGERLRKMAVIVQVIHLPDDIVAQAETLEHLIQRRKTAACRFGRCHALCLSRWRPLLALPS